MEVIRLMKRHKSLAPRCWRDIIQYQSDNSGAQMQYATNERLLISGILTTAATFTRGTAIKMSFLALAMADFFLTLIALYLGFRELNPLVARLFNAPGYLVMFKVMIPIFLAWLIPSRFLIPSLALLTGIMAWNLKELLILFF